MASQTLIFLIPVKKIEEIHGQFLKFHTLEMRQFLQNYPYIFSCFWVTGNASQQASHRVYAPKDPKQNSSGVFNGSLLTYILGGIVLIKDFFSIHICYIILKIASTKYCTRILFPPKKKLINLSILSILFCFDIDNTDNKFWQIFQSLSIPSNQFHTQTHTHTYTSTHTPTQIHNLTHAYSLNFILILSVGLKLKLTLTIILILPHNLKRAALVSSWRATE